MNALKRASNIRKLSELQGERKDLLDKCGDDFGATAIGGQVQFGNEYRVHSDQVAIIAMSVNSVTNKNTQAGAYAIVWLDKERDNEFGTHNGPATGSLIFLLKAVQDVLRQSDSSKPLIIASNNHLVCNFINGETPSISKDNSHLGTHLKSIENYIKTRTAPTHSYWLNAGKTRDSRVQRFYDLAKDVASVARKLWLDKGSGFREEAVKSASPAPDRRSPSLPRNERQQSEVRLPEIPPSLSAGHGAGLSTRAIEDIDRQRAKLIQRYGMEIAVATNRGEDRIAVIGMSVEQPDASNCQLGGYGVVWLRCNYKIQLASHYGPDSKSMIFLLQAVQAVLDRCSRTRPLIIALKNQSIVNFINDGTPLSISRKSTLLESDVENITNLLQRREARTRAILITANGVNAWMNGFYSLSMQVASDARKTGLMKQTRETQYSLQPALSPQLSSQKHQQQIQAHEDVPYQRERSRYSDWSLSELEDERKRILQQFQCQVGHDPDKLGQIIVTVAMSVDSPKENGNQLGGYGVVWFHEGFPNQVGYYDGPFNGTSIFILLAMRDALVASRPDRPLLIGMKHQAVYNYMSGHSKKIPFESLLTPYVQEINELISGRTASVELFLIKGTQDKPWHELLYDIAKTVAREGRKQRNYEGVSRRRNLPSLPAAEEPFTAGLYTDHQIRKEEGFTDHANHPLSPPAAVLPPTAHSPTGTTSNLENEHHLEGIHPARAAMLGLLDNPSPIEEEEEQCATKKRPIEETSDNDAVRDESLDANKRRKTTVDDHDHDGEDETVKTSLKQLLDFNDWHTAVGNFKDWVDGMLWG